MNLFLWLVLGAGVLALLWVGLQCVIVWLTRD